MLSSHALPTKRFQVLFSIAITSFFNNALPTKGFLTGQCTKVKSDSVPDDLFEFQSAQTSNRTDLVCLTLSSFEFHPQKDRNFKNKKKNLHFSFIDRNYLGDDGLRQSKLPGIWRSNSGRKKKGRWVSSCKRY